jgi:hypothetical protein
MNGYPALCECHADTPGGRALHHLNNLGHAPCHVPERLQDSEGQYDPTIEHDPEFDPYECEHESVDTRDEADGVAFGGASHHEVSTCLNCGANLYLTEPDEDGQSHWEVDE